MSISSIIIFICIGAISGWLAGAITKGSGFGILGNIGIGIVGAFIGGFLMHLVGFSSSSIIVLIISATIGAVILLLIVGFFKKHKDK